MNSNLIKELQIKQQIHDEACHQDILAFKIHDRLKHLILHFAKYCGKLHENTDENANLKIYTDVLICSLSASNLLNINLSKTEPPPHETFNFPKEFAISCGRMAKACEALDHLEALPFREIITNEIINLAHMCIRKLSQSDIDIHTRLQQRWANVESRNIVLMNKFTSHSPLTVNKRPKL